MAGYETFGWIQELIYGIEDTAQGILQIITQNEQTGNVSRTIVDQEALSAYTAKKITGQTAINLSASKAQYEDEKKKRIEGVIKTAGITITVIAAIYLAGKTVKK